jgi:hypothetical protein
MRTVFPSGLESIKLADFAGYKIASLNEDDLNLVAQKCLDIIRTSDGRDSETAKAMLHLIAAEKNFRVSKFGVRSAVRWARLSFLAFLLVGLLQGYIVYWLATTPVQQDDDGNSCEQSEGYSV